MLTRKFQYKILSLSLSLSILSKTKWRGTSRLESDEGPKTEIENLSPPVCSVKIFILNGTKLFAGRSRLFACRRFDLVFIEWAFSKWMPSTLAISPAQPNLVGSLSTNHLSNTHARSLSTSHPNDKWWKIRYLWLVWIECKPNEQSLANSHLPIVS